MTDAALAITNLISESHYLVDIGRWSELTSTIFVAEEDGLVPEADFGFASWRGAAAIDAGYAQAMPRFEAAAHAFSNLHLTIEDHRATARYYLQGWHWYAPGPENACHDDRNADYLILGVMTDQIVRQRNEWRVLHRRLERLGPGPAVGALAPWLQGLGTPRT